MFGTPATVLAALILSISAQQAPFAASNEPKVVDLGYAQYQSDLSLAAGVTSFLGVRYAAPPTGQLRWRKPQPPESVVGIQDATIAPASCFQAHMIGSQGTSLKNPLRRAAAQRKKRTNKPKTAKSHKRRARRKRTTVQKEDMGKLSEDCLFLNVHVPTTPKSEGSLPVIVYIHGGAYDAGNATMYPVQDFVKASNYGLISVGIQYRLGVLGFLSGVKVKTDGDLNVGLLDQNFALQWVQNHISAFGGDPSQVTIWGQSAGASSMLQHVVAHAGNTQPPLFRAVMMNSPWLPPQYSYEDPIIEWLFRRVASHVNCNNAEDIVACLRSKPASELQDADDTIGLAGFLGTYTFVPVVDGEFIVERPAVTLKRGKVNGNALLVSANSNEGAFFVPPPIIDSNRISLADWTREMFPRFTEEHVAETVEMYSNAGTTVAEQGSAIMGDSLFVCPAIWTVMAFGERGYKSKFAIPPGYHAQDLAFEFSELPYPRSFADPEFFKSWQQSFISVALSLNPNIHFDPTNITPEWPAWGNSGSEMLFSKTENDERVIEATEASEEQTKRCAYWMKLSAVNNQ